MSTDWLNNNEAVANVKRLLTQMVIPLENRVARICADPDRWFHSVSFDIMVDPSRTLYGEPDQETALREIDQTIMIQTFLSFGQRWATSFEMQVLIECKHREGLAVFGFPFRTSSDTSPTYPVISELAFTSFAQKLSREVTFMEDVELCTIGLLDNMHRSPKISEEQLVYKAGASLYDFIRFQTEQIHESTVDSTLLDMGILDAVIASFEGKTVYPTQLSSLVLRSVDDAIVASFMERFSDDLRVWVPLFMMFVPIICVDAPLFRVEMSESGEIQEIQEVPLLITSARLPKWPSVIREYLLRPTPEALITVVNVNHLGEFLDSLASWFNDMGQAIDSIEDEEAVRCLLQNAVMRSVKDKVEIFDYDDSTRIWRI